MGIRERSRQAYHPGKRRKIQVLDVDIYSCVGVDGRRDPVRIAGVIQELDADMVGLQEVDPEWGAGTGQIEDLGGLTGVDAFAGITDLREDGHYGNALLTNWPVVELRRVDLSVRGREPRGAIDALLNIRK